MNNVIFLKAFIILSSGVLLIRVFFLIVISPDKKSQERRIQIHYDHCKKVAS